jgi:4-amino-4-deoxy-L-arabinose transferase-like glycosyltransferase
MSDTKVVTQSFAAGACTASGSPLVKRLVCTAVFLFVAGAWFGSLELRGLFVPDEGRYAEIPREMLASGDWVTPRLTDLKYFEKPPFQYWLTALSFQLFGVDEWTARLPAALAGFLAMLMIGYTGYRLWNARTGLLAATVLAGSWAYFLAAQYLTLDMMLTSCLTSSLCCFLLAQKESSPSRAKAWMSGAWAAAALAVLSKGLVSVVLPGITLLMYVLIRRNGAILRRINFVFGVALFGLITMPWFVAVQLRNPEFFHFFFIHEHIERFSAAGHHRPGAWWYYIPIIVVGLLPWTPAIIKETLNSRKGDRNSTSGFSPELFCALWAIAVVLFFSASQSKLPAYILPALPAIALLFAERIHTRGGRSLNWSAWGTALIGFALIGLIASLSHFKQFAQLGEEAAAQIPWLYGAAITLVITGFSALWALRIPNKLPGMGLMLAGTLCSWNLVFGYMHALDANFSSERLIESLTKERRPFQSGVPFYSVGQFDPSVPFYLGRTLTLVESRGELGPGIDAEPSKAIPNVEKFESIWLAEKAQAYAIMRPDLASLLRQRNLPMVEIVSDGRLMIVSRRSENHESK